MAVDIERGRKLGILPIVTGLLAGGVILALVAVAYLLQTPRAGLEMPENLMLYAISVAAAIAVAVLTGAMM